MENEFLLSKRGSQTSSSSSSSSSSKSLPFAAAPSSSSSISLSSLNRKLVVVTVGSLVGVAALVAFSKNNIFTVQLTSALSNKNHAMDGSLLESLNHFLFGQEVLPVTEELHSTIPSYDTKKMDSDSTRVASHPIDEDSMVKLKDIPETIGDAGLPQIGSIEDPLLSQNLDGIEATIEDPIDEKPIVIKNDRPAWDANKAKPVQGFYFPEKSATSTEKVDSSELAVVYSGVTSDMAGAPTYMDHRHLINPNGLVGKNVLFFDMSRDSKVADYADGQYVIAAVENDALYYSSDSGETFDSYGVSSGVRDWMAVTINFEGEKMAALVRGADKGTAKGSTLCTVWRSNNFGVTWYMNGKAGTGEFTHMVANFEGSTLYVTVNGANPGIKYTHNSGQTWVTILSFSTPPVKWTALATDYNGDNVYAASEQQYGIGALYKSGDGGKTYKVLTSLGSKAWNGIYAANWGDRVFFTAKNDTSIYFSKDAGSTYSVPGNMPLANMSLCVSFEQFGGGFVYAIKPGEFIYKSYDKGNTFHTDKRSGKKQWNKCLTTSMATFDMISVTNDGFWTDKADALPLTSEQVGYPLRYAGPGTDDNNVLSEVGMSDNGMFTVAGFGNLLQKGTGVYISADRGLTWTPTRLQLSQFETYGMDISNDGMVIAINGWSNDIERNVYISKNGGKSWSANDLTKNGEIVTGSIDLKHIFVTINSENVDISGAFIVVSHDFGDHFDMISINYTSFYMWTSIVSSQDGKRVYLSSFDTHGNGYVYRSSDYGEHWFEIPQVEQGHYIDPPTAKSYLPVADWSQVLTSGDGKFVIAQKYMSNLIWRSSDYGVTWLRSAAAPDVMTSLCMDSSGNHIMGTSDFVYRSFDGGLSWGKDTISGEHGWSECRMSSDGTKVSVKRLLLGPSGSIGSGVYVNEPFPPTPMPTTDPTREPLAVPSKYPTFEPTPKPSVEPTVEPSGNPIFQPTPEPTKVPIAPTFEPSYRPTLVPILPPTVEPTFEPTFRPTLAPVVPPTVAPSLEPTTKPSADPTLEPTRRPNAYPTLEPTHEPTLSPTPKPSSEPTLEPSPAPSLFPTYGPTLEPVDIPTMEPTPEPSMTPTHEPTLRPSAMPSLEPTLPRPSAEPTLGPTDEPTVLPTVTPTFAPTFEPTRRPSALPTFEPTRHPVSSPTQEPYLPNEPTQEPSKKPVMEPTEEPTRHPHTSPTFEPTVPATDMPTNSPVPDATPAPTNTPPPSADPTKSPRAEPTLKPTDGPTAVPSPHPPTPVPSSYPPTLEPTKEPTRHPVAKPTREPTHHPVTSPTKEPFTPDVPTFEPSRHPQAKPTHEPTKKGEPPQADDENPKEPVGADDETPGQDDDEVDVPPTPRKGEPTAHPTPSAPTLLPGTPTAEPTKGPFIKPTPAPGEPTKQPVSPPSDDDAIVDDDAAAPRNDDAYLPPEHPPAPLPIECKNDNGTSTFCPGLLPATVAKVHLKPGCVLLSTNDLSTIKKNPKYQSSAVLVICSSADSGVIKVDENVLTEFDMVFEGQSLISSIIFGPDTQLNIFSGGAFDGAHTIVQQKSPKQTVLSLNSKKYGPEKPSANDNVRSFELTSGSSELNKCEDAMAVYYFEDFVKKTKRLRVRA